jgi:hypothetical protein
MHNALIAADRTRQTAARQVPVIFLVPATQMDEFVTGMEHRGNRAVNGQESCEFARWAALVSLPQGTHQEFPMKHGARVARREVAVHRIFMARGGC